MTKQAILYRRVSSLQQKDGLGLDRQLQEQIRVCEDKGWIVSDESVYSDIASAFHGKHLQGALGAILEAVESGKIGKGHIIVIESLDRLGREYPLTSLKRFIDILEKTDIYEFSTGMTYSTDGQGLGVMIAIASFIFERAHNESLMKQRRTTANWQQKKDKAQGSDKFIAITKRCPAWIEVVKDSDNTEVYQLNDNAKHVQMVFEEHNKGITVSRIIDKLNNNNVAVFGYNNKGGEWTISRINRLLGNHAVYGAMKSTKGEITQGRYPSVITKEEFDKAALIKKQRNNKGTTQRKEVNVLSGLMRCSCCGHSYTHGKVQGKNDPNNPKKRLKNRILRCRHRMVKGNCNNKQVSYYRTLGMILRQVRDFEYKSKVDTESIRLEIQSLEVDKASIQNLLVIDPSNAVFVQKFQDLVSQIKEKQEALEQAVQEKPDTGVFSQMVQENTPEEIQLIIQRQLGLILKSVVVDGNNSKLELVYLDGRDNKIIKL